MSAPLIDLVEDGVCCSKGLNELDRWVREVLGLEIFHHLTASKSHHHVRVHLVCVLRRFSGIQSSLQLVNTLKALDNRVHIAGVAQVLEASRSHDCSLLVHDCSALCWRHILNELGGLRWLPQTVL